MESNPLTYNLLVVWFVSVLIITVSATDRVWAVPSCADLLHADKQVKQYEEDLAIYEFLREYDREFENSWAYLDVKIHEERLKVHRGGDDGQEFKETCQEKPPIIFSEKQFCKDFRNRDSYLLSEYEKSKAKFREYVAFTIRGDPDFVALGYGGQPLATNLDDFNKALEKYKWSGGMGPPKSKAWLEGWLERDPTIHTRCGPDLGQ